MGNLPRCLRCCLGEPSQPGSPQKSVLAKEPLSSTHNVVSFASADNLSSSHVELKASFNELLSAESYGDSLSEFKQAVKQATHLRKQQSKSSRV